MTEPRTGWLIYRQEDITKNSFFIKRLKEAAKTKNIILHVISYEELETNVSLNESVFSYKDDIDAPSFIINRSVSPWLNEVAERAHIRVFNRAEVARIANDKRLSYAFAASINVPMLSSVALQKHKIKNKPFTVQQQVIKEPHGRGGKKVFLLKDTHDLHQLTEYSDDHDLLRQTFGGVKGKDLRVYIVANEIVASVLRHTNHNFKANLSLGASASIYTLNEAQKETVQRILNHLPLDFGGIDFLFAEDETLLFNEIEDAVGCRSLYMHSDIDIAALFIEHVNDQLRLN